MKTAWFSPLPPDRTEIANYSNRLLPYLHSEFELEVFTQNNIQEKTGVQGLSNVNHYTSLEDEQLWRKLNPIDYPIYNIGNNSVFHRSIWEISLQKPGIVILHDQVYQHFFIGMGNNVNYLSLMVELYGEEGRTSAAKLWSGMISIDELVHKYPMTEHAIKGAVGVVVHTKALYEKITRDTSLPVLHLNLPYDISVKKNRQKEVGCKPYSLVVFGFLGHNRRLNSILHAFAHFPERDQFTLTIIGEIWDHTQATQLVHHLGLDKEVEILGYVAEEELDRRLSQADLAFNLRYPTVGEASSCQLRIWEHSLPSLVTNIGWYADLPSDTVFKIELLTEVEEIQKHLQMFLNDPGIFREIGENGYKHLKAHHCGQKYASGLKAFLHQIHTAR